MATRPRALAGARIVGERFVHSRRLQNPEGRMPLLDHLRELRNRVVKMALALVGGKSLWTARVSKESRATHGAPLELAVDTRYLQFFDPASGLSIGHPLAAGPVER